MRQLQIGEGVHPLEYGQGSVRRLLFVWCLPCIWLPAGVVAALFPSDLNLVFYLVTLPAAWMTEIVTVHGMAFMVIHISGTAAMLALAGLCLDFLGTSQRLLAGALPVAALAIAVGIGFDIPLACLLYAGCIYLGVLVALFWSGIRRLAGMA